MLKDTFKKFIHLLLLEEKDKKHYVLIKGFNTFLHYCTLHHGKKLFCRYCLQAFSTKEMLKCHIYDCFKIDGK